MKRPATAERPRAMCLGQLRLLTEDLRITWEEVRAVDYSQALRLAKRQGVAIGPPIKPPPKAKKENRKPIKRR